MKVFFIWVSISLYIEVQFPRSETKEKIQIQSNTPVLSLLKKYDIKPDTCLTLINNHPVPIDTEIKNGESLKIVEVTSGG